MKVLIPLEYDWIYRNPFVGVLNDEFAKYSDVEIITGVDKFWNHKTFYDVIHIYWPQCLLQGKHEKKSLEELRSRIDCYKAEGTKIVSTCLNLAAHYSANSKLNDSYSLVYSLSDIIIHLAEYSQKLLEKEFPNVKNVIIEHHIYDTLYKYFPTKEEANCKLGIKSNSKYILSFGTYRSEEERQFVFKVAKEVYKKTGYKFLIPTLYLIDRKIGYIKYLYYKIKMMRHPYIKYGHAYVDKLLPYYYAACEISFIQRIRILNSGNVPMAFFWGHVVVGTQEACVGDILRKMGNPTFDYKNIDSVVSAVVNAIKLSKEGLGLKNQKYVMDNCTVEKTCEKIYNVYKG